MSLPVTAISVPNIFLNIEVVAVDVILVKLSIENI